MNDILIQAFIDRINAKMMELAQVPIPYKEAVEKGLNKEPIEEVTTI